MKVKFVGVATMEGIAKASKKPFCMHKFFYAVSIAPVSSPNFSKSGFGFEVMEVEIDPGCMSDFALCELGELVDIEVQPNPVDLTKNIVTGIIGKSSPFDSSKAKS
ncbi:hypothetical protein [Aeromonas veronii]|uniref:hypothetical protein n=1 Tax=Aeromonas veronii TaxID=654 RepID=UPI003D21DAF1